MNDPKIYLVGGAVRDFIMNRESNDKDYVVVGATPEWMIDNGYSQVGSSFPVFLHPVTGAEYALARQERKNGVGYNGFDVKYDPAVTLEDDLLRRDLTINSMAMTPAGVLIDPYGGLADIKNKVLTHTSEAFADDPLRVLRVARFAARYPDFTVSPETVALMKKIVDSGELNTLPKERIWAELFKGLKEPNPVKMMMVLKSCGATEVDPLKNYVDWHFEENDDELFLSMMRFDAEIKIFENEPPLEIEEKFLLMFPSISLIDPEMATWLRIPSSYYQMARQIAIFDEALCTWDDITPEEILELIQETRYDRSRYSFETHCILHVLALEEKYGCKTKLFTNLERLNIAVSAINNIDWKVELADCDKRDIKDRVHELKLSAIQKLYGDKQ